MIEIKNLHKSYRRGKEIIPNLDLSLGETGLTMIVGKSGCGKTTLLNIVGAMDLDFEGQVVVDGLDIKKASYNQIVDYRNFTSAFVFQKNSLFEFLTVEENLKLCMNIQNNTADISDALEKVGLKGFEHKKVKSLSGGEKQRVAIARALIKNCKIIFADEPTSALDTKNAHKIFQLFKEISKDKLVVLVTHDLKKAVLYADRIIRFVDGVPVEDTTYNQVSEKARELPERKTKKLALLPIFKNHLKKGLAINMFVTLLLIAAITVTNLAMAGTKVKNEYDYFGTDQQVEFNVDRAITTQINNNINLFNIVKSAGAKNAYTYLENGLPGNTKLNVTDNMILENVLANYNVHKGTNDSLYNTLVINTISNQYTMSSESLPGASTVIRYWERIVNTNYIYYLYDETNNYNLIEGGRLPDSNNKNEILVSDVVAWHYIQNKNRGIDGSKDDPESFSSIYDEDFVIYDTYGRYDDKVSLASGVVATNSYYLGTPKSYKVVGVIDTGLLDYFTYDVNQRRYLFNSDFKNQDNDRYAIFMNSAKSQPFGYVVLQEHMDNSVNNPFYHNSFNLNSINFSLNDVDCSLTDTTIQAFIGKYDYTTNPAEMYDRYINNTEGSFQKYDLVGYEDNLSIDRNSRLIALSTPNENLQNNEVIISSALAKKLFPNLSLSNYSQIQNSFVDIANKEVEMTYNNGYENKKINVKIVGISNTSGETFYVSNDLFKELYVETYGQSETLTLDLTGKTLTERKRLMETLYSLGYNLAPVDLMPGSYLEFVDGKGETFAEVDGEGLKALYPYHEIVQNGEEYYFVNDGVTFGIVEVSKNSTGEIETLGTVYMTSTMVKKIALDESYITKNIGNLSLYYLFSEYYTYENTNTGNYILEIMGSMYTFLLGMALVIAIGFVYLKENKESGTLTRLSMLGVRPGHIYLIHLITYVGLSLIIAVLSVVVTYVFVDVINGMFTYSFESGAIIHRVRLMFETPVFYATGIITLGFFILSMISSFIVTYRSRK